MIETQTRQIGALRLGAAGRLSVVVPVGAAFRSGSFAKTARERAGKAPLVRDDGTRLGTVASITETEDGFTFDIDSDAALELDGLETTLRFRPIGREADIFTEVAVWELEVPAPGPSPELRRRRLWLAAQSQKEDL